MSVTLNWSDFISSLQQTLSEVVVTERSSQEIGRAVTQRIRNSRVSVEGRVIRCAPARSSFGIEVKEVRFSVADLTQAVLKAVTCFVTPEHRHMLEELAVGDCVRCVGTIGAETFVIPPIDWFVSPVTGEARIGLALSDVVCSKQD